MFDLVSWDHKLHTSLASFLDRGVYEPPPIDLLYGLVRGALDVLGCHEGGSFLVFNSLQSEFFSESRACLRVDLLLSRDFPALAPFGWTFTFADCVSAIDKYVRSACVLKPVVLA